MNNQSKPCKFKRSQKSDSFIETIEDFENSQELQIHFVQQPLELEAMIFNVENNTKSIDIAQEFHKTDEPNIKTQELIDKMNELAKTVDLNLEIIKDHQEKDCVLSQVIKWLSSEEPVKTPETKQNKAPKSYERILPML